LPYCSRYYVDLRSLLHLVTTPHTPLRSTFIDVVFRLLGCSLFVLGYVSVGLRYLCIPSCWPHCCCYLLYVPFVVRSLYGFLGTFALWFVAVYFVTRFALTRLRSLWTFDGLFVAVRCYVYVDFVCSRSVTFVCSRYPLPSSYVRFAVGYVWLYVAFTVYTHVTSLRIRSFVTSCYVVPLRFVVRCRGFTVALHSLRCTFRLYRCARCVPHYPLIPHTFLRVTLLRFGYHMWLRFGYIVVRCYLLFRLFPSLFVYFVWFSLLVFVCVYYVVAPVVRSSSVPCSGSFLFSFSSLLQFTVVTFCGCFTVAVSVRSALWVGSFVSFWFVHAFLVVGLFVAGFVRLLRLLPVTRYRLLRCSGLRCSLRSTLRSLLLRLHWLLLLLFTFCFTRLVWFGSVGFGCVVVRSFGSFVLRLGSLIVRCLHV